MRPLAFRDSGAAATGGPLSGETATEIVLKSNNAPPLRGLMVCGLFTLPYRALRCFSAAGVAVHVIGNTGSDGLRRSRFCAGYTEITRGFDGTCDTAMIEAVNTVIARAKIDFVFAGDQPSTRSLIAMAPHLRARCFPMPDLATFDLLNNKERFTALCGSLDIRCPPTQVFADRHNVLASIDAGETLVPAVIKPLSLDGNRGVSVVDTRAQARDLKIDYQPVLVQRFIVGADIGASVFAYRGDITGYICHQLRRATYTALDLPVVHDALVRIVAATGATGILNFDMRLDDDGTVHFLECNPRVFYKMPLSMQLGVNFAGLGLQAMAGVSSARTPLQASPRDTVRSLKAILATALTPWRLGRRDASMLRYILTDPVPYIRETLRIDWEDRSY